MNTCSPCPPTGQIDWYVKSKVEGTQWQRGLTNMAQAFNLAGIMLSRGGRRDAQSAVLVLSDGKYSLAFSTAQQVQKLKDTNTKVFMANPAGQWKKCTGEKPNCGLLHDTMSLQWGKFKDLVDELTFEMSNNADAYEELKGNLNDQLTILADAKTKSMELLAETISSINADTEETNEKDTQHHDLEKAYKKRMAECKAQVEEILFTNICVVRQVRNAVMEDSTVNLTGRYEGMYFGVEQMQVGVLLFGNGAVMPDGTIAPAINVQGLTFDMAAAAAGGRGAGHGRCSVGTAIWTGLVFPVSGF